MNEVTARRERIIARLDGVFAPASLEVRDVSASHTGHAGWREAGETHFEITIAAEALRGLPRIEAHRAINAALADEFASGLHALQIKVV